MNSKELIRSLQNLVNYFNELYSLVKEFKNGNARFVIDPLTGKRYVHEIAMNRRLDSIRKDIIRLNRYCSAISLQETE